MCVSPLNGYETYTTIWVYIQVCVCVSVCVHVQKWNINHISQTNLDKIPSRLPKALCRKLGAFWICKLKHFLNLVASIVDYIAVSSCSHQFKGEKSDYSETWLKWSPMGQKYSVCGCNREVAALKRCIMYGVLSPYTVTMHYAQVWLYLHVYQTATRAL